jgi:hypothetical protein
MRYAMQRRDHALSHNDGSFFRKDDLACWEIIAELSL